MEHSRLARQKRLGPARSSRGEHPADGPSGSRALLHWLSEPTLHFFVIGALLFAVHHAFVRDPRTIVVTAGVKADVARRFADQNGRRPSPSELDQALGDWKREEALSREARREGLDRDDATIRAVLADKVRHRAALEAPKREPTQADLDRWLAAHQSLYETPLLYDYEFVSFDKTAAGEEQLGNYERSLAAGGDARALGRPIAGGALSAAALRDEFGAEFANEALRPPLGRWQRVDARDRWRLARVTRSHGGLPSADELRPRLVADWSRAEERRAVERAVDAVVARYRFEERP